MNVLTAITKAKKSSSDLARSSQQSRKSALEILANLLEQKQNEIIAANKVDITAANELVNKKEMSEALFSRLKLDTAKIAEFTGVKCPTIQVDIAIISVTR